MSSCENAFVDQIHLSEVVGTHDPDDRHLDSEMLLNLLQATNFCFITDNVLDANPDEIAISDIDFTGSKEPISLIIYKISSEILVQCFEDENLHRKTLFLLETLSHYKWDAKAVLALASFTRIFGLFQLVSQKQSDNALAVSLANVKRLPMAMTSKLKPKFKALNLLVNTMVKLTKYIIRFEGILMHHELVDDNKDMDITKSMIYTATNPNRTVITTWGIYSLGTKLNSLCQELGEYVDKCQGQIETRLYDKLLHMFKENKDDNQLALRTLFASQNKFPFKNASSGEKCGIEELRNKVVILLISKPELFPMDKMFFLLQQTCYHPNHTDTEEHYAIIWVPIQSSREWTHADKATFELVSNSLPWFSIRTPWSLNSTIINYIKHEWDFGNDPIMVVLDENSVVTNSDAMDMVWIWGPTAFPFSASRENELWGEANWDLHLIINGISALSSHWVEEGQNLCIFGSDNLEWIREINATIKKINSVGIQLEVVYVGCKNPSEKNVRTIIDIIDQEKLCSSLTLNKVNLFWFRLETIKKSIDRQDPISARFYKIAAEVSELLELNSNESWAVIGGGSSTDVIKIDQEKMKEFIDLFPLWSKNVAKMGLVGGIRSAFEAQNFSDEKYCHHNEMIPFEEGLIEDTMVCGSCKRHVDKFVLYKCDE
ncbi:hypothetical protein PHJA_000975600 [Phtheirospermum japonicum]|uniref:Protein SIEVE ELEMENT OCCLUSION C n=1 Tax=Phtheirospermum japonicum TaxID=374723 RepID=A0A830BR42_9LAMI|nr:hypothetical protein PHJA_000975600 [Phtheirospermum japonicum]